MADLISEGVQPALESRPKELLEGLPHAHSVPFSDRISQGVAVRFAPQNLAREFCGVILLVEM
jgi:hypothetical protein